MDGRTTEGKNRSRRMMGGNYREMISNELHHMKYTVWSSGTPSQYHPFHRTSDYFNRMSQLRRGMISFRTTNSVRIVQRGNLIMKKRRGQERES